MQKPPEQTTDADHELCKRLAEIQAEEIAAARARGEPIAKKPPLGQLLSAETTDWNARDPGLLNGFDSWPKWAVDLDIEIADLIGGVGCREEDDTPEGRAAIAAYERVREIIRGMLHVWK